MATPDIPAQANSPAPHEQGETPEMVAAFHAYVQMGSGRSIKGLAAKIGVAERTVNNWSKRNKWKLRILTMQEEASKQAQEEIKVRFFEDTNRLLDAKNEIMIELQARTMMKGKLSVNELIAVLNMLKTELGEPTSIAKGQFTEEKPNPFAGIFESFFGKKNDKAAVTA